MRLLAAGLLAGLALAAPYGRREAQSNAVTVTRVPDGAKITATAKAEYDADPAYILTITNRGAYTMPLPRVRVKLFAQCVGSGRERDGTWYVDLDDGTMVLGRRTTVRVTAAPGLRGVAERGKLIYAEGRIVRQGRMVASAEWILDK